jgi:hypothetical protein
MRRIFLGILEPLFHYPYMRFYVTAQFQTIAAGRFQLGNGQRRNGKLRS